MADGQTLNVKFRADTADFDERVNRIKEMFTSLSSKMQETKDKIKITNDELKQAVTEFEKLSNQKSIGLPIDEKEYKALAEHIVVLKDRLSEFTVDEKLLNTELKLTNKELEEQYKALLLVDKNIPVTENVESLGKAFGTVENNMPKSSELTNIARAFIPLTSNIKGAGTAVNILKSAIGTGSWIGFAVLALNLAISAVTSFNSSMEEVNKIAAENARQSIDKIKNLKEETEELRKLAGEYMKLGIKVDLTGNEKKRLSEIQESLNTKYGIEYDTLDLINGKYEDQIIHIKELTAEKLIEAQITAQRAKNNAEELYNIDVRKRVETKFNPEIETPAEYLKKIKDTTDVINSLNIPGVEAVIPGTLQGEIKAVYSIDVSDAEKAVNATKIILQELGKAGLNTGEAYNGYSIIFEDSKKIVEECAQTQEWYNQLLSYSDENIINLTNDYDKYNNSIKKTINPLDDLISKTRIYSSAISEQNEKGRIQIETAQKLIGMGRSNVLSYDEITGAIKLQTDALKELNGAELNNYKSSLLLKQQVLKDEFQNVNSYNASWLVGKLSGEISAIDNELMLINSLITENNQAMANSYSALADQYEETSKKRIDAANAEKKAIEKAYKTEIDKINEALEARKRLRDESDQYKKINEINARLKYDQLDEISRYELERERERLEKDWADTQFQWTAADNKESLEKQYKIDTDNIDVLINNINASLSNLNTVTKEIEKSMMPQYSANVVNEYNDLIRNPTFVFNASDFTKSQLEDLVRDVMRKELYDR